MPDEILHVSPLNFKAIGLCLDDLLPVNMVLLLGYSYRISPQKIQIALKKALWTFPHLSGKLSLSLDPLKVELVEGSQDIHIEWVKSSPAILQSMEDMDQQFLMSRFAPSAASAGDSAMDMLQRPLLQLRLSWLEGGEGCVLGVMVSHMALDGSGLGLFLNHLTSAVKEIIPMPVEHNRKAIFPQKLSHSKTIPQGYRDLADIYQAIRQAENNMSKLSVMVFSVHGQNLREVFGVQTFQDAKLQLTSHICQQIALMSSAPCFMALWCNTRGLANIPRNYTGNTGCYIHFEINSEDPNSCFEFLKGVGTRKGFAMVSDIYSRLKCAESEGKLIFWEGPAKNLISVNLVPHLAEAADFGGGVPVYGQLLTRNVPGLRLYTSPDNQRIVAEMCFEEMVCNKLLDYFQTLGLTVKQCHIP